MTLIGLIPGLTTLFTKFAELRYNAQVAVTQARVGGDRDVAVSLVNAAAAREHERTSALTVIAGSTLLTFLLVAFAAPLVIFEWKVVVWDIVLGWGSTDAIRGQVADWANTIIAAIFGSASIMALGQMWFNRKTQ